MRFYNFEKVLLDERIFFPADLEQRDMFGMPVLPDDAPALRYTQALCSLEEPCVPGIAA